MINKNYPGWQIGACLFLFILVLSIILWLSWAINQHAQSEYAGLSLLVSIAQACFFWWQLTLMRQTISEDSYARELEYRAYPEVLLSHGGGQATIWYEEFVRPKQQAIRFTPGHKEQREQENGRSIHLYFYVKNSGRTTAYDLLLDYDIRLEDPDITDDTSDIPIKKFSSIGNKKYGMLFPNQVIRVDLSTDQVIKIKDGYDYDHAYEGILYIVGKFSFLDQFNKKRWFDFSYKFEFFDKKKSSKWEPFHHMSASSDFPKVVVPNRPVDEIICDWRN
ncbi:hypothetical protein [Acidocella facilis]|uniref:hypothetical protein n=1 Tax=Acidocella facilis TaxID=525 RepID=UPI001F40063A|nr:hypothetical protein [Acidocella facilis]